LGRDHVSLPMIQKYVGSIRGDMTKNVRDVGCFCGCRFRFVASIIQPSCWLCTW